MDYSELIKKLETLTESCDIVEQLAYTPTGEYRPCKYSDRLKQFIAALEALTAENERLREAQRWIAVNEKLPEVETEVFILAKTKTGHEVITTAMYENGKIPTGDSVWNWYDVDFDYDEENDEYLIPEGWWEYRHYNSDDVYNNAVDDVVTHWMTLPAPPQKGRD